jgi:hypothetical protein
MNTMEWKDPTEIVYPGSRTHKRVKYKYQDEVAELRSHPGEWAVLRTENQDGYQGAASFAYHVRTGVLKAFPAGEFEAAVRTLDGITRVHVRYVGRPETDA